MMEENDQVTEQDWKTLTDILEKIKKKDQDGMTVKKQEQQQTNKIGSQRT
jgi:hypothetical protein